MTFSHSTYNNGLSALTRNSSYKELKSSLKVSTNGTGKWMSDLKVNLHSYTAAQNRPLVHVPGIQVFMSRIIISACVINKNIT